MAVTLATPGTIPNMLFGVVSPVTLANALAIRDTLTHDASTGADAGSVYLADLRTIPGAKTFYINNTLNQNVTCTLIASYDAGTTLVAVGSGVVVNASTQAFIDASNIPQLANPYPYVGIRIVAASSPASGTISAYVNASTAGGSGNSGSTANAGAYADGSMVTLGALADAAVGDASGTVNAHLRQIAKLLGATGNQDNIAVITSAAITTNTNSADQTNTYNRGALITITTGAFGSGATAIVATVKAKDPVSGNYTTILASASLTASTVTTLTIYPGLTAAANSVANANLPKTWRVELTASAWGTGGSTVGVAASILA